jgi:hypothetical protein
MAGYGLTTSMDSALRYAYWFDLGCFLLFTCAMLLMTTLLLRRGPWFTNGPQGSLQEPEAQTNDPDPYASVWKSCLILTVGK